MTTFKRIVFLVLCALSSLALVAEPVAGACTEIKTMRRSDYPLSWPFSYCGQELLARLPCPDIELGVVTHGSGENESWPALFEVTPEGNLRALRVVGLMPSEQTERDNITKAAQEAAEALLAAGATTPPS